MIHHALVSWSKCRPCRSVLHAAAPSHMLSPKSHNNCSLAGFEDIRRRQGRKDQSLDGASEDAQAHNWQWDDEWHQEGEDGNSKLIGQDISKETEAQTQWLGEIFQNVDWQQDWRWLHIPGEVAQALPEKATAEVGNRRDQAQSDGGVDVVSWRGKLTCWQLQKLPWHEGARPIGAEDEEEDRGDKWHPWAVERLAQVVLGNIRSESKGHLLEVPDAGRSLEI